MARPIRKKKAYWMYVLLMVLAVYTAVTWVKQEADMAVIERAKHQLEIKIATEQKTNKGLLEQKQDVGSDASIEAIARDKLGYVKDGERVFVDGNK